MGGLVFAFGWFVWPSLIDISPKRVVFSNDPMLPSGGHETYTFRLINKSDDDIYLAQFKFRVENHKISGRDFTMNIPPSSRKAFAEHGSAKKFTDTVGFLCRDADNLPIFSLTVFHLLPHESREVTITAKRAENATMLASTGFVSTNPEPLNVTDNGAVSRFAMDESVSDCRQFMFFVDEHDYQGMFYFDKNMHDP